MKRKLPTKTKKTTKTEKMMKMEMKTFEGKETEVAPVLRETGKV